MLPRAFAATVDSLMASRQVYRSTRVVTPSGVQAAAIHVDGGRITAVEAHGEVPEGALLTDVGDRVILPGLVDSHVHINDPGRAHWEGFQTATRAAAAGGVTTLVDMPLNSIPPTTTRKNLAKKRAAAKGNVFVDVAFWGGAVPTNLKDVAGLFDAGALRCEVLSFAVRGRGVRVSDRP